LLVAFSNGPQWRMLDVEWGRWLLWLCRFRLHQVAFWNGMDNLKPSGKKKLGAAWSVNTRGFFLRFVSILL
jgi:hypothetical protein